MEIAENRQTWNVTHDWTGAGEEWSVGWGGSEAQWFSCLYPRIHRCLPATRILEIAPGFGRWTHYLLSHCRQLIGVDLSEVCVEASRRRFAGQQATFYVNDGTSLAMVPDFSVDFVFSFDSLVHAEAPVLEAYVHQLARKLTLDGVGFIHHSNLGAYPAHTENPGHRAPSMTAERFLDITKSTDKLTCVSQELVNWAQTELVDCLSVIAPRGSRFERPFRRVENHNFMAERDFICGYSSLYHSRLP
jgi:SAM-dependent methyltransferase